MNGYQKEFIFLRDYDFGFGMGYADWAWVGVGVGVAKTRQNISSKLKEKGDYCSHIRLYIFKVQLLKAFWILLLFLVFSFMLLETV